MPPYHPIVYGPAPPGQRVTFDSGRRISPPGMMQGPMSQAGMPTQAVRRTAGPTWSDETQANPMHRYGFTGAQTSPSSVHSQHSSSPEQATRPPQGSHIPDRPTTNDHTQHAAENAAYYDRLPRHEAIQQAYRTGQKASQEYFHSTPQRPVSGMGGGRRISIPKLQPRL